MHNFEQSATHHPTSGSWGSSAASDSDGTGESGTLLSPRALAYPKSRFVRLHGIDVHHLTAGALASRVPAGDDEGRSSVPAEGGCTEESGEGPERFGVMLAHHFYGSAATWRAVLESFGDHVDVVAMDRPGFGLTERPRREFYGLNPYTRSGAAKLGWELLDHLGVHDTVLVGSSAGGTHVLEMYAQQPERVRGIVLIGAAITGDVGAPARLRPALRAVPLRWVGPSVIRRLGREVSIKRITRSWADASRAAEDVAEPYRRMLRVEGWERGLWELFTAEAPPDLRWLLGRITVPTLVVTGDRDPVVTPRDSERTATAIPGARLAVIEDCGHTPQEERPDRLLEILDDFLTGLLGRDAA